MNANVTEEIKQRIDIVELISRYVPTLRRAGSSYKGNCPFHEERTPSFVVFPHTGTWHCFGACGVGGDAFSFLMRKENLDFPEALQQLADQVGVEVRSQEEAPARQKRNVLYEVNQAAADYYRILLHRSPLAKEARVYLQSRQIDSKTAEHFQLGFALNSWDSLRNFLLEKGYQQQDLLDAGLLKHNQERSSTYDAFRNRLMIPIQDRQGRTIGFGGRVLDKSLPKYLNTAETPLFHKSHVVYGIDLAHTAIRDTNQVVIVEGYMDVIAAHQYGYRNVVACMGTALTSQQLQQLQRYTDNYVLALDADNAGQQATVRGLNQARQALSKTRKPTLTPTGRIQLEERLAANLSIASMPEGRDPDDIIRQDYTAGTQQWPTIVQQALPLVDFYFNIIAEQVDLKSAQGKGVAVAELTPLIAELGDEIEHHHYIQKLSRLVQIDEVTIAARVQAAAKTVHVNAQGHNQPRRSNGQQRQISPRSPTIQASVHAENRDSHKATLSGQSVSSQPTPQTLYHESQIEKSGSNNAVQPVDRGPLSTENYLLAHLLRQPDLLVWLAESSEQLEISSLEPKDFVSIENQGIFRQLKKFITSDDAWDLELFQETLAEQLHGHLAQLVVYGLQLPETNVRALREDIARIMLRLRLQNLNEAETRIKYLLAEAQERNDREFIRSFGAIRNQNLRELYHLQRVFGNLNQYLVRPEKSSTIPNTASNITVNM